MASRSFSNKSKMKSLKNLIGKQIGKRAGSGEAGRGITVFITCTII